MALPPNNVRINDRATLEDHLNLSERLFQAYSHEFGMSVQKDSSLLIDDSHNFEFLKQWAGYDGSAWWDAKVVEQTRPQLRAILATLYFCNVRFCRRYASQ